MDLPHEVKGFQLVNPEKVERALYGTPDAKSVRKGGIANPTSGTFDEDLLLAEYDKLGGLITRNGDRVKMGSFYDFGAGKPREKAEITFVYRVNGRVVEVADGVELPGSVKAAKVLAAETKAEAKTKKKK